MTAHPITLARNLKEVSKKVRRLITPLFLVGFDERGEPTFVYAVSRKNNRSS
ncbi:MAG TPA: hypothetical protein VN643_24800 [Pyrinomonadaceae bacterium]|nr:hypothetical protein [Pyrinomonadaceae bacterium]